MTSYKILFCALFVFMLLSSCRKSGTKTEKIVEKEVAADTRTILPVLPVESLNSIKSSCDLIDFIFFDLPISISQDNQVAIQQVLGFISPGEVSHSDNCKAIAHAFFMATGETILEADLFSSEGCQYFIFYEEGKPKWSNGISLAGQNFFHQIISQSQTVPKTQ